jgi:uncharacterized protein YqgC (DUF456 family)
MAKKPLWEEILPLTKKKYILIPLLIILSLLGIVVPIIPGIALFILAIMMMRKGTASKLRRKFRLWKIKDEKTAEK